MYNNSDNMASTQGDEEETRIALQRKQANEADTWREMCSMSTGMEQQVDSASSPVTAQRGDGAMRDMNMHMKLIGQSKESGGGKTGDDDDDDDHESEDTDLPQGTR